MKITYNCTDKMYIRIVILILCMSASVCIHAKDFLKDGVVYRILSEDNRTCAIVGAENNDLTNFHTNGYVAYENETYNLLRIEDGAFKDCVNLRNVTISNKVKYIGENAFIGCTALRVVIMYEGVTYIGASAFEDCINLTAVNIPCGVTTIKPRTFYNCTKLPKINLTINLQGIEKEAFTACTSLNMVDIPKRVNILGDNAFADCKNLKKVRIHPEVIVGKDCFAHCHPELHITDYPSTKVHPFCEEGKVWVVERSGIGYTEYWTFSLRNKMLIDGRECMVCSLQGNPSFDCAIYEENGRVYKLEACGNYPRPLYDFTLEDNEIFRMDSGAMDWTDLRLEQQSDYVTSGGDNLRRMTPVTQFTSYQPQAMIAIGKYTEEEIEQAENNYRQKRESDWIEGVGSLYNPFFPITQSGVSFRLVACVVGEKVLYLRDGYEGILTNINTLATKSNNSPIETYNIDGKITKAPINGMYIKNGKKFIIQ